LDSAAAANGANWAIHTVPRADEGHEFVQGGALSDLTRGATIEGPASICFNSAGRLVGNAGPGVDGANCEVQQLFEYTVKAEGADRPLTVQVTLGGQVRMCEPTKKLSSESPQGCKP
jgi:type IV fimbrial biogenesis protein FimT